MRIIPAVDLLDGKAVQLQGGHPGHLLWEHEDPVQVATDWWKKGADQLHVIERFSLDTENMTLTREYVAEDPVYFTDQYIGSDTVLLSDVPYVAHPCDELTPEFIREHDQPVQERNLQALVDHPNTDRIEVPQVVIVHLRDELVFLSKESFHNRTSSLTWL
jgi:hypothetical protein